MSIINTPLRYVFDGLLYPFRELSPLVGLLVVRVDPLWIHAASALLVTSCVIREDNHLAPFLRLRLLTWIGSVSYGMYLMHMLGYNVVKRAFAAVDVHQPVLLFVTTSAVALGVATLSFRYYESIFLKIGKRYSR